MCRLILALTAMSAMTFGGAIEASEEEVPSNRISVERTVEDGIDLLLVTVIAEGKPMEGATVQAYVERTFGKLVLGEETTFDDGTAFIPLPSELPPATSGRLIVFTEVTAPAHLMGIGTSIELAGAPIAGADLPPYPHRALWARHAPVSLLATLVILFGGVWATYGYVAYQVHCLRKGR